jgi:hypothetical protein
LDDSSKLHAALPQNVCLAIKSLPQRSFVGWFFHYTQESDLRFGRSGQLAAELRRTVGRWRAVATNQEVHSL